MRAAVESVFPLSSVARFLTLDEGDRQRQIDELARITLGICLYNRHAGKGGGRALPPATQAHLSQAARLQRDLARQAAALAASLATLAALQAAPCARGGNEAEAEAARERAAHEAVNVGQALTTFQQLSADLNAGLDATGQLEQAIQSGLVEVRG